MDFVTHSFFQMEPRRPMVETTASMPMMHAMPCTPSCLLSASIITLQCAYAPHVFAAVSDLQHKRTRASIVSNSHHGHPSPGSERMAFAFCQRILRCRFAKNRSGSGSLLTNGWMSVVPITSYASMFIALSSAMKRRLPVQRLSLAALRTCPHETGAGSHCFGC